MENEEKSSFNPIWIIIIVIGLIIVAFYFGRGFNNQASTEKQVVGQMTIVDPKSKCDIDAKNYFDDYKNKQKDTNTIKMVSTSYQNYYNQDNGSCYVLTNGNFNAFLQGNYEMILYSLVDVSRKDATGNYQWIGQYSQNVAPNNSVINGITDCNVSGKTCYSLNGFLALANPYLGK